MNGRGRFEIFAISDCRVVTDYEKATCMTPSEVCGSLRWCGRRRIAALACEMIKKQPSAIKNNIMSTSKKTNKSSASAKKASIKMKDLGAKSNPRGGKANRAHAGAFSRLQREKQPNLIQF